METAGLHWISCENPIEHTAALRLDVFRAAVVDLARTDVASFELLNDAGVDIVTTTPLAQKHLDKHKTGAAGVCEATPVHRLAPTPSSCRV